MTLKPSYGTPSLLPTASISGKAAHVCAGLAPKLRSRNGSVFELAQNDARVVPAEPERVGDGDLDVGFARVVRDVVEVASGIRRLVVDRRRQHVLVHREDREDRLDRTG